MKPILFAALVFSGCATSSSGLRVNVQCGRAPTLNEEVKVGEMNVEIDLAEVEIVDNKLRCFMEIYEAK